jgi:hypothetical protein
VTELRASGAEIKLERDAMRSRWWLLFVLGGLAAVAPSSAGLETDTLEANRLLLEKWRADPEHYRRLQRDLIAFHSLPSEHQERLRRFDRELHGLDEKTRTRLWRVLDRYSTWLEPLPDEERQKVLRAKGSEKLQLIRDLRQQQWVDRLPLKLREEVLKRPPESRGKFVADLRRQERERRVAWMQAPPPFVVKPEVKPKPEPEVKPKPKPSGKPERLADLPDEVQRFVRDKLVPRLNKIEHGRLLAAQGKWPQFTKTIVELSNRHPVLPPGPRGEITTYKQLPPAISIRYKQQQFARARHRWPDYALAVTRIVKPKMKHETPLGASKLDEFPKDVQKFVRDKLLPALSAEQKKKLHQLEGHWPEYPLQLLDLARQKRLVIPGMSLPGPNALWDGAL